MKRPASPLAAAALAAIVVAAPSATWAWGGQGHRMVGTLAMEALPPDVPAFLKTRQSVEDVGEFSREPDRVKRAGAMLDADREPSHFIDLGEDGRVLEGPPMLPLAASRAAYEAQLRAFGLDQWKAGYLPYALIDRWQNVAIDLAYYRVLTAGLANPKWREHHAFFKADLDRRKRLILANIGNLSHLVGDGSQPLHVSKHFNGWGPYPNPNGYSNERLHGPFEGELVRNSVKRSDVARGMTPLKLCGCAIEKRVGDYLARTGDQQIPLYEMVKAGGMAPGDRRGAAFATERLAAGASELRDLIVEAWAFSATMSVGYRPVAVRDVVSGKTDPYNALMSID